MFRNFRKAYRLLSKSQRKQGAGIVVLLFVHSIFDFFTLAAFVPLIVILANKEPANDLFRIIPDRLRGDQGVFTLIGIVLAMFIAKSFFSIFVAWIRGNFIFRISERFSGQLLENFLYKSYSGFSQSDFSSAVNRICSHPITFANQIVLPITNLIAEVLVLSLIVAGVAWFDPLIIGIIGLMLLPILIFYRFIQKRVRKTGSTIRDKYPLTLKQARQVVEGYVEIRTTEKANFFIQSFRRAAAALRNAFVQDHVTHAAGARLIEVSAAFVICLLVAYTVFTGQNSADKFILLGIYAGASFRVIPSVSRILQSLMQIRTHSYLLEAFDVPTPPQLLQPTAETRKFSNALILDNISASYEAGRNVLRGIDLKIVKGEKVALCGKSGEGKTTLLLVMLGLLDRHQGAINIDGRNTDAAGLRGIVGYVPQNPFLLDGTIYENIAFGQPSSEWDKERIEKLVDQLGLRPWIDELPGGVNTQIGERGLRLSGGQRQRIAIARALYASAQILLMDEVTNNLDPESESALFDVLRDLSKQGTTLVMISHRIHQPEFFDAVYRLNEGKLMREKIYAGAG